MKKKILLIAVIFFSLFSINAHAGTTIARNDISIPKDSSIVETIQRRVLEIQSMDLSKLNGSQRKALRHELKGMYNTLLRAKDDDGGGHTTYIYIGGSLLVIILLLILILR